MWIRSQNRKTLAKVISFNICKNIRLNENDKFEINGITNGDDYWTLGLYESEKRALEVLDDIQGAIAACEVAKTTDTIKAVVNTLNEKQFASVALGLFIYQMPEK